MPTLDDLFQRVDHLMVRHAELQRTQTLLQEQVASLMAERDALRSRLQAARTRMDALLARLPPSTNDTPEGPDKDAATDEGPSA
jgi:cell division protein ZapB